MERMTPEAAARALSSASTQTPSGSLPQSAPLSAGMMATLWVRMTQMYAHRWTSPHGESPDLPTSSAGTWAKGLAGMTGEQLAAGLKACIVRADPWPPTLPEFRALCLGIPSLSEVRRELGTPDSPRSGFAVLVWSLLDTHAYRRAEGRAAERLLGEAYDEARERVMRGEPVPAPHVPLPPPAPRPVVPAAPEVVAARLAKAKAILAGMPDITPGPVDESVDTRPPDG